MLDRTYVLDVCTFSILVPLDDDNQKMVVSVQDIRLSAHKDVHPSDSEDNVDIGLSSEEEAEDLPEDEHIRRKYVPPPPAPEPQQAPPASQPAPGTSTSIQVPVEALQKVQEYIGQLLGGDAPPASHSQKTPLYLCPQKLLSLSLSQRQGRGFASCARGSFGQQRP